MEIQKYVNLLVEGNKKTKPITGLCGRIVRGVKTSDFEMLSDDPSRKLVMLMGPDGLQKLIGKNGYQMLIEIGYEGDYIARKIDEGNQFKLVVFGESELLKIATWDNVISIVCEVYPDIKDKVLAVKDLLKTMSFDEIQEKAGFNFANIDKAGESDHLFMTYERLIVSSGTVENVRAFLYFSVYLKELFSGDGYTYTCDKRRGLTEYIAPNKLLTCLGDYRIIDLDVKC